MVGKAGQTRIVLLNAITKLTNLSQVLMFTLTPVGWEFKYLKGMKAVALGAPT